VADRYTIQLRKPRVQDAIELAKQADNPAIFAGLRDYFPSPYSVDDALRFIETVHAKTGPATDWFITVDDRVAGVMGLFLGEDVYRHNAEIGYWLGEEFWGRGIMTACIQRTVEFAWKNFDVTRIYAEVFSSNAASIRVLEKCGFEREYVLEGIVTKLGERCDSICMGIRNP